MSIDKVNLAQKFSLFQEHWSPKLIGELNGQHVRLAKIQGAFDWHSHEGEDELFLVIEGSMVMRLRDREIPLEKGEMLIVPRGVEHQPYAEEEVHLLLFDTDYGAPSAKDARKWSEHFDLGERRNIVVMAGDERFLGPESFKMIPGFFLVDQDFVLRADSTGHHPQDDLFRKLLPMIPTLL